MPPRRSAAAASAAAGKDQGPTLKLIMEKGPLSGYTGEFRPGTTVQIGRLVRGNTIAIKDSGISSNHLRIQGEAASDENDRRWTAADLDSSNGTILNDAQLKPFEPAALSHGDVIKIGERTSIRVEIVSGADNEAGSGVRRNARRRVRALAADLVEIDEDEELGLQSNDDEEKIEVEAKQGRNVSTRRTRSSARNGNLAKSGLNVEENTDLGPSGIKGLRGVSTRRARSSRKEENVEEIEVDLSVIEGKKTTRGGRGRKKLFVETISEEAEKEEPNPEHTTREEEKQTSEIGADELKISGTEGVADQESNAEAGKEKIVVDLEKMSLGEWLDFYEEYEPREIIAKTEEMLAEIRRKAERCHEFMLQQKKLQGS